MSCLSCACAHTPSPIAHGTCWHPGDPPRDLLSGLSRTWRQLAVFADTLRLPRGVKEPTPSPAPHLVKRCGNCRVHATLILCMLCLHAHTQGPQVAEPGRPSSLLDANVFIKPEQTHRWVGLPCRGGARRSECRRKHHFAGALHCWVLTFVTMAPTEATKRTRVPA